MSSYAGKTVTIIFRAKTDASLISSFSLDDTALFNSSTCTVTRVAGETQIETMNETPGEDIVGSAQSKPEVPAGPEEFGR